MSRFTSVGLGEILWDLFPSHRALGGAPANFAYISQLLGDEGCAASRVGDDELGTEVRERLAAIGLNTSYLQSDYDHPTGTVQVELEPDGQPRFTITPHVAWDYLAWTREIEELAARTDAVCFGTLAQRSPQSRNTIQRFIHSIPMNAVRIFDVNLRQTFYSAELLAASAEAADIVKMNQEEAARLARALGSPVADDLGVARWLCELFELDLVCVTRGSAGSLLVRGAEYHEHSGHRVLVTDTVGAGDAFTATLVHHYLRGADLATINEAANRMGSLVASRNGATPALADEELVGIRAL